MKALIVVEISDDAEVSDQIGEYKIKNANTDEVLAIDTNCKLIIPRKKTPEGSEVFNDYVWGYNDCINNILKGE